MLEPMQAIVLKGKKYGSGADAQTKRTSAGLRAVVFGPAQVTVGALLRQSDEMRRQSDANSGCLPAGALPTASRVGCDAGMLLRPRHRRTVGYTSNSAALRAILPRVNSSCQRRPPL